MKTRALIATAAAALLLAGPAAHAAVIVYTATLDGLSEAPPNNSPGTGFATVTYNDAAFTLRVQATFSGLTGTTTAAHIHCCTPAPGNVGVASQTPSFTGFPLGVTSGTYDSTFDLTLASSFNPTFVTNNGGTAASASAALLAGMNAGQAYFNIHTTSFGGGEIRGFLQPQSVPEPGTALLLALGAATLALGACRSRGRAGKRSA